MGSKVTYDEYIKSERYVEDMDELTCGDDHMAGYVYLDGFYVIAQEPSEYIVPIGNGEYTFDNLTDARRYLWDEFAKYECNYSLEEAVEYLGSL